jgi:hypothetical protein
LPLIAPMQVCRLLTIVPNTRLAVSASAPKLTTVAAIQTEEVQFMLAPSSRLNRGMSLREGGTVCDTFGTQN